MASTRIADYDQDLLDVTSRNFKGGMDAWNTPEDLATNQACSMKNGNLSSSALSETRPGCRINGTALASAPIRGLCYYDTPAPIEQLIAACNGTLKWWDKSAWHAIATYTVDPDQYVEMIQAIDKLYICDGIGNVQKWDGTSITDLGNTNTNPPRSNIMAWIGGRLLGAIGDTVYYSDEGAPETFNRSIDNIRVGFGNGSNVVAMKQWDNFNLVVAKENSMWAINADPTLDPGSWFIEPIHLTVGCAAPRTLCQVGNDMWWLSHYGVKSLRRLVQDTQKDVSGSMSEPIRPILNRLNYPQIKKSSAFFWDNRYFLSVPIDGATEPNYVVVWNTLTQSWQGFWTNLNATAFAIQCFAEDARLVFGDKDGRVRMLMDRGTDQIYDDDGAAIPTELISKGFTWSDVQSVLPASVKLKFYKSQATAKLEIILDQSVRKEVARNIVTGSIGPVLPVALPFLLGYEGIVPRVYPLRHFGKADMIQFVVSSDSGYIALRSITASAYLNAQKMQK